MSLRLQWHMCNYTWSAPPEQLHLVSSQRLHSREQGSRRRSDERSVERKWAVREVGLAVGRLYDEWIPLPIAL